MTRQLLLFGSVCLVLHLSACTAAPARSDLAQLQQDVANTERAFAKTMADRDHAAFTGFLSDEAVFFGSKNVFRGKQAVADSWKRFYSEPTPPFSWEPEKIEVLDSGTLALSSGPVRDAAGKIVATYSSIWRFEAPGRWRIVFDKGCDVCNCTTPAKKGKP